MAQKSDEELAAYLKALEQVAKEPRKLPPAKPASSLVDERIAYQPTEFDQPPPEPPKPYAEPGSQGLAVIRDAKGGYIETSPEDYYLSKEKMAVEKGTIKDERNLVQRLYDRLSGNKNMPRR